MKVMGSKVKSKQLIIWKSINFLYWHLYKNIVGYFDIDHFSILLKVIGSKVKVRNANEY